jgi:hypothetical protein
MYYSGLGHFNPSPATLFGAIQRFVAPLDERFGRLAFSPLGQPGTESHLNLVVIDVQGAMSQFSEQPI